MAITLAVTGALPVTTGKKSRCAKAWESIAAHPQGCPCTCQSLYHWAGYGRYTAVVDTREQTSSAGVSDCSSACELDEQVLSASGEWSRESVPALWITVLQLLYAILLTKCMPP